MGKKENSKIEVKKKELAKFSDKPTIALIVLAVIIIFGSFLARNFLLDEETNIFKKTDKNNEIIEVKNNLSFEITEEKPILWGDLRLLGVTSTDEIKINIDAENFGNIKITRLNDIENVDKVIINDKEVEKIAFVRAVAQLDEIILITYGNDNGISKTTLVAYNKEGTELFNYNKLPLEDLYINGESVHIVNNKIIFEATRVVDAEIYMKNKIIDLCDKAAWEANGIVGDEWATAMYEIEYLENERFNELSLIDEDLSLDGMYLLFNCEIE